MTHLGRALDKLGVEIIYANSPQAKGRVERVNGTLQDRLVAAMRLTGISSIDEANTFLPSYLTRHNARFACAPADPRDVHRALAAHENVEAEMVWREERTVTASLALHFNKAMFILEATPLTRSLARKRVRVCEYPDGRIEIRHGESVLPYRVFDKMRQVNQAAIVDNKQLGAALRWLRPSRPLPSIIPSATTTSPHLAQGLSGSLHHPLPPRPRLTGGGFPRRSSSAAPAVKRGAYSARPRRTCSVSITHARPLQMALNPLWPNRLRSGGKAA